MCYSCGSGKGLDYLVTNSYSGVHGNVHYLSKNIVNNDYSFRGNSIEFVPKVQYEGIVSSHGYNKLEGNNTTYEMHSFAPQIFLKPARPKATFIDDENQIKGIIEETFELMIKDKLPGDIFISILSLDDFKAVHSLFGRWNSGILGFSINAGKKKIFVKENSLDELMLVIGHEIGHVLTKTLPNKHDEEAKAFAFSVGWARTIKENDIANLGASIKDQFDFNPAINGLHDVAFAFVDSMLKRGRKAMDLHGDLVKSYISVFDKFY